jgi:hypothetical protein
LERGASITGEAEFNLLRGVLKGLGLPEQAVEDIIAWILDLLSPGGRERAGIDLTKYHLREDLLSAAELNFFQVLTTAVGDTAVICPKVSLGDLFYAKTGDCARNLSYRNRIERKHVDFLLCEPNTLHPVMGIELDDRSHEREDRVARDRLVDGMFKAAGLPLKRIRVQHSYDNHALRELLGHGSSTNESETRQTSPDEREQVREISPPACPKCGAEMVLRTAKRGKNRGEQFWGCPEFPRCRGIRQLT